MQSGAGETVVVASESQVGFLFGCPVHWQVPNVAVDQHAIDEWSSCRHVLLDVDLQNSRGTVTIGSNVHDVPPSPPNFAAAKKHERRLGSRQGLKLYTWNQIKVQPDAKP